MKIFRTSLLAISLLTASQLTFAVDINTAVSQAVGGQAIKSISVAPMGKDTTAQGIHITLANGTVSTIVVTPQSVSQAIGALENPAVVGANNAKTVSNIVASTPSLSPTAIEKIDSSSSETPPPSGAISSATTNVIAANIATSPA